MDDIQRLRELADRSYNNEQFVFTDFLSMAELSVFYDYENELRYASPQVFGGCEIAERKIIRFGSEDDIGYVIDFPIVALKISPLAAKFADKLNHRDFLGALMNLGIKREVLGDIYVKDKAALVFCKDTIADYIIENLTRVKHTSVKVVVADDIEDLTAPTLEDKVIQVASTRIDAVIAKVYNMSRQEVLTPFKSGFVFLNGRVCTENAKTLSGGDIISVRGYGKFEFAEELNVTKKGKTNCKIRIYK
ncbi:MAG TPA: hypothetical protein DCL29_07360 [Eubacterium sp.]|nr:hypothetical protein [Eubacterium sp.]